MTKTSKKPDLKVVHGCTKRALERRKDMTEVPDVSGTVRDQDRARDGLTAKQEGFCQDVAGGMTLSDAYRANYNTENMKQSTVHQQASAMMSNPKVAARVNALLGEREAGELHERTRLRRLVIDRLQAEATDPKNPAASRVSALKLLGQLDIVQVFRPDTESGKDDRTPEEIRQELMRRMVRMAPKKDDDGSNDKD